MTVVFLNGYRTPFKNWDKVYPEVAKSHRVLLFNRRGVGRSAKAEVDQSGDVIVKEIHDLLHSLYLKPPYLLVGHSFGGLFANLYARTYPQELAGMVLVDSSHPKEPEVMRSFKPHWIVQQIFDGLNRIEKWFDPFTHSEDESIDETLKQIEQAGPFPNLPLAILTGTKRMPVVPEKVFNIHMDLQKDLLNLSSKAIQRNCEKSGHFPQITEPNVVIETIRSFIDQADEALPSAG